MSLLDQLSAQASTLLATLNEPVQVLALASAGVAALLVVISAFVKTMIPLRWLAVASNVGFIVYGLSHPAPLMVVLHAVLLPVNLWRVRQMVMLTQRVAASAADSQQLQVWLRPYMRSRNYRAGETVFANGEEASRMYFLASGEVELPEVGRRLLPGQQAPPHLGQLHFTGGQEVHARSFLAIGKHGFAGPVVAAAHVGPQPDLQLL